MSEPILMPFQDLPFNGDTFVCKEFLKLKNKHNITTIVETGSCLFSSTKWFGENFDKVYTVEINEEFAKHGRHKVENLNVKSYISDSVSWLYTLENELKHEKCIFFLDAHWGSNCPLKEEINAIGRLNLVHPPLIVIHDFYTGNPELGYDEYNGQPFTWDWILENVYFVGHRYSTIYDYYFNTEAEGAKRGVIYIEPKKTNWVNQLYTIPKWKRYSQAYEEGYLEHILQNIKPINKHIVELGAWDGYHLSNTRYFIEEKGYKALLIDGDNHWNEEVKKHFIDKDNIIEILEKYDTPESFDLFCIDLDGNDIYVIDEVLSKYKPSVVLCEYNPIFAENESYAIQYDAKHTWNNDNYYGFSFAAGIKSANKHGYTCIFQNDNLNMYFVKDDVLAESLGIEVNEIPQYVNQVKYQVTHYHPISNKKTWVQYV
jgi:hypothetical protein